MTDLSQDELAVLLIAAEGEPMMPIGRWKPAIESLVARGYLQRRPHAGDPTGQFNHHITPDGRKAAEAGERDSLVDVIDVNNAIAGGQQQARSLAEAIAVQLVDLTELSHLITGEAKIRALRNWAKVIVRRAMELMK